MSGKSTPAALRDHRPGEERHARHHESAESAGGFNNVAPLYGTDERILFTSDRPRSGEVHLYPQLDEYEEAPTVTGLGASTRQAATCGS